MVREGAWGREVIADIVIITTSAYMQRGWGSCPQQGGGAVHSKGVGLSTARGWGGSCPQQGGGPGRGAVHSIECIARCLKWGGGTSTHTHIHVHNTHKHTQLHTLHHRAHTLHTLHHTYTHTNVVDMESVLEAPAGAGSTTPTICQQEVSNKYCRVQVESCNGTTTKEAIEVVGKKHMLRT